MNHAIIFIPLFNFFFIYLSSYYLHHLILKSKISRDDLYKLVQEAAFEGQKVNSAKVFFDTLKNLLKKKNLKLDLPQPTFKEIKNIYLKHTETVFKRTLKEYPLKF